MQIVQKTKMRSKWKKVEEAKRKYLENMALIDDGAL